MEGVVDEFDEIGARVGSPLTGRNAEGRKGGASDDLGARVFDWVDGKTRRHRLDDLAFPARLHHSAAVGRDRRHGGGDRELHPAPIGVALVIVGERAPLWRERSRHRHLESVTVPLDRLKAASKAAGTTVNGAFVAAMADAAVKYHQDRDAAFDTLNVSFIISTRTDNKAGGNAFTPVLVQLPAVVALMAERIETTTTVLDEAKEAAGRSGGITALSGVANLLPTSVVTRTARSQAAKIDIATSSLRGAPVPLFIGGAEVLHPVTMGPLAGTPCNATALSYCNNFDIGLFIDPVAITEPDAFRQCVVDAFGRLLNS